MAMMSPLPSSSGTAGKRARAASNAPYGYQREPGPPQTPPLGGRGKPRQEGLVVPGADAGALGDLGVVVLAVDALEGDLQLVEHDAAPGVGDAPAALGGVPQRGWVDLDHVALARG